MRGRSVRAGIVLAVLGLLAGTLTGCGSGGDSGEITINYYSNPQEHMQDLVDACNKRAAGRYRIVMSTLPRDADGQREQLVRRLAAEDSGLDVMMMDITWTAELAEAGWIRPWTGAYRRQASADQMAKPLQVATWRHTLYAAPFATNVQLLWYRTDLVPTPPKTWDQLIATSNRLAAQGKPHYTEEQGAQYEGLVVWFNALLSSAGGRMVDRTGKKLVLGKPALTALQTMHAFTHSHAADPALGSAMEDQGRLAVEGGRAAMELNWPNVYTAMQADKPQLAKHFTWAPYPGIDGHPGTSPLGGNQLAISKYSRHPRQAFDAALCLRGKANQRTNAVESGLSPTYRSLYDDPGVAKAFPMRKAILQALKTAAVRPQTPVYQNLSTVTSTVLSPPSSIDPQPTLDTLTTLLGPALRSEGVLP